MIKKNQKRILLVPLDWGLGHTARCIPILRHLIHSGHEVIVACNTVQAGFIDIALPGIEKIMLDGYNIRYSGNDGFNKLKIAAQAPAIFKAITREHNWLQQQITKLRPDGIISDNRYGIYHHSVPSIIITHQPGLQTGLGRLADWVARQGHYRLLSRFNEVWIPDSAALPKLAGKLTSPGIMPPNSHYIGLLSQFGNIPPAGVAAEPYVLVLLSGPEPQRTKLQHIVTEQVADSNHNFIIVGGSAHAARPTMPAHVRWHPVLAGEPLGKLIEGAALVVCRSGYSTLMDLLYFGKKAVLIPTPGQAEQEYLSNYLSELRWFTTAKQSHLQLDMAINEAQQNTTPLPQHFPFHAFIGCVDRWLGTL